MILNEHGNINDPKVDHHISEANKQWILQLKPLLDDMDMVDMRIVINMALYYINSNVAGYVIERQVKENRERRAKLLEEANDISPV